MKDRKRRTISGGRRAATALARPPVAKAQNGQSGFTLLELIITLTIIAILAAGTVPIAYNLIKREKEMELRRNLREIRMAIDAYKIFCDTPGNVSPLDNNREETFCYPPSLNDLVEGVRPANKVNELRRFLRRIPRDPFTGNDEWGLRSLDDDPDSSSWGGKHVFDVYSRSQGTALDGSKYVNW